MAYGTRAYFEQTTNQDVLDRIEIQEDGFSGTAIELKADGSRNGFKWRLSEITSESDKGLINPLANKIQVGKLTFFPRIETSAEQTLLDDILGSPDSQFRIVWKQDGSVFWTGNIDNKRRSYPETGASYFATIRANDFEILKSTLYTSDGTPSGSLIDNRQTLISTVSDLLGYLNFGLKIRTATSWITKDTTDSTDFLSQVYHETRALREFASTGDESDQPISVWDALLKVGDPVLLFRQVNGEFTVEQLTEFDDPANVHETVYTSAGAVDTATTTVDRTLSASKATSEGSLVVKDDSQNDRYPAIKRATATFEHRSQVGTLTLPANIYIASGGGAESYSSSFISTGDQEIQLSANVIAQHSTDEGSGYVDVKVRVGQYYYDGTNWTTTTSDRVRVPLNSSGRQVNTGSNNYYVYKGFLNVSTPDVPTDATTPIEVEFEEARIEASPDVLADNETSFQRISFEVLNPNDKNANSTAIRYELTQSNGYTTTFGLDETWFGDGPTDAAPSALRFSSNDGDITSNTWQRRGSTAYRNFHQNLLKEILDLQRTNTRKIDAKFWGTHDPSKILVYDSQNFYTAGISYVGHRGRWSASLFRINVQTGSDTFEEIPKFGGTTAGDSTGGGGGSSTDTDTLDARYFNESNNLSEGDPVTLQTNIGLKDQSADLDLNSVAIGGDDAFDLFYRQDEIDSFFGLYYSKRDLESGDEDLDLNSLDISGSSFVNTNRDVTARKGDFSGKITGVNADFTGQVNLLSQSANENLFRLSHPSSPASAGYEIGFTNIEATDDRGIGHYVEYSDSVSLAVRLDRQTGDFHVLNDFESNNFASGWLADGGKGFGIQKDANATAQYNAEFNNLLIRGRLKVFELIVKQIATLGGTEILSVAVAEADSVSGSAGSETVTITDPRNFGGTSLAADDLVIVQRVDLNDTTVVKQEFRTVSSVSGTDVSMTSTSGAPAPSDPIEPGDIIVAYGNTTDTARQNMMYRSVEGELVSRFQAGVDSYSDFNSPGATSNLIMGDLDDAQNLSDGTTPAGFGFYAKGNAYFDGHMVAQSGDIAKYLTVGDDVRIGQDISTASERVRLGMWDTDWVYFRVADGNDTPRITIGSRGASSPTAPNTHRFVYRDQSSNEVVQFGDLNGTEDNFIASWNIDKDKIWNYDSGGGVEMNATNQFIKMYEDNGTTERVTIDASTTTLPSSASIRDSITNGTGPPTNAINIADQELIKGTVTVSEGSTGSDTVSADIVYQGYNGGWVDIQAQTVNLIEGGSTTRTFRFSGLEGFTQFRVTLKNLTSGSSWSITDYDVEQFISETVINAGGASFVGGGLYFVDFLQITGDDGQLQSNQVYLESDGSGNYNVKVRG